jgi:hypothetical protein
VIRYISLIGLICLLAGTCAAQNRYDGIALGPRGPVSGASIAVCTQPAVTTTAPCTPLANLFTDSTLTIAAPNPLLADALGNFHFYVAGGFYTVQIYGAGISPPTVLADQAVFAGAGTVTDVSVTNNTNGLLTLSVANPTTAPDIVVGNATAPANNVWGNCTTSPGPPSYCFITGTMLPFPGASSLGGVESITCPTHEWIDEISTVGVPVCTQPTVGDIVGFSSTGQVQAIVITSGICTTGSGAETTCSMGPFTWPSAFANTSYAITCSTTRPTTGGATNPGIYPIYYTSKSTTQFSLIMQNGSASAAGTNTVSEISCIGIHP